MEFPLFCTILKGFTMHLTPVVEKRLSEEIWRIFTNDKITEDALIEYLSTKGNSELSRTEIFYDGKMKSVFIVEFEAAFFLAENRVNGPYSFTAYHRKSKNIPWQIWKEGKKEPWRILESAFKGKNYESPEERNRGRISALRQKLAPRTK